MTPLTIAIDAAVDFVRAHPVQMTRNEVEELQRLAKQVYVLAFNEGLVDALPQVSEMQPQLESTDSSLPQVQFESKLNLPGDWDLYVPLDSDGLPVTEPSLGESTADEPGQMGFLVCATPRWLADMETLRTLAEEKGSLSQQPLESPSPRLKVDLACMTVTLDGTAYDETSERALRWVNVLAEHPNEWISGPTLEDYDSQLINVRTDRLTEYLPPEIFSLVDSETGKGSRFRLGRSIAVITSPVFA